MLKTLQFVKGAVARKDFVPALTHFRIESGFIKGFNGSIALCAPIDLDLEVSPLALPFIKAIQASKETVAMHVTPTGRLSIKSGKFKSFVECTTEVYPEVKPSGEMIELKEDFLDVIKMLNPFIAEDASRPWARGILFCNRSAFATNNLVLVEYWLGYNFPEPVNIPKEAVKELLRIKEAPTHMQLSSKSVTFHFEGGRWLRSNLFSLGWPDVTPVLDVESNPQPLPENFFEVIEELVPFVGESNALHLAGDRITTDLNDEVGTSIEMSGLPEEACFNGKSMASLSGIAEKMDLTLYPRPLTFVGDNIRGVLLGRRV